MSIIRAGGRTGLKPITAEALGEGRPRCYFPIDVQFGAATIASKTDTFPIYIPLSADGHDIFPYIDQSQKAQKPMGYQHIFLDAFRAKNT